MILRAFHLPTALTSICAYKSLVFFDFKRVKYYILITGSGDPELLEHRRAEKNKNYPEKSLKNKEQEQFKLVLMIQGKKGEHTLLPHFSAVWGY